MAASETREKICEAALRTATRDGVLAMTLDNVAKEAGVSKGGVMYHFPTKNELVQGMLEYFGDQLERMMMQRLADDPEPRLRWARSLVSCVFPPPGETPPEGSSLSPEAMDRFLLTALAAAVNSPGLIAPLRQVALRFRERILKDPRDGMEQLLVWLALDGLFLWQFVGLIRRDEPLFAEIGEALREKVGGASAPPVAEGAGTGGGEKS